MTTVPPCLKWPCISVLTSPRSITGVLAFPLSPTGWLIGLFWLSKSTSTLLKRKLSLKGVCWSSMFCPPSSRTELLHRQPRLVVIGGATKVPPGWLEGYCASKALCVHHEADTPTTSNDPQCPGCGLAVHADCGYFRRNAGNKCEAVTCSFVF
jgi:hypothetical protein